MSSKISLQKNIFPRTPFKAISLFTAVVFLCTGLPSFPSQVLAQNENQSSFQGAIDASLLASASATSGKVQGLVIPPEIGTLIEEFGTRGAVSGEKAKLRTKDALHRTVFLIQDAHSVPEAQRSLEKLIEHLQSKYGVATVALEGAEGKLDATLFRSFPDSQKRENLFDGYLNSGELSGAAAASVLSPYKADYVGIEDRELYQKGVAAFLDGLKKQPEFDARRLALNAELQKLKTKYYSPAGLELDKQLDLWGSDPAGLFSFLDHISTLRMDLGKFPLIDSLCRIRQQEKKRPAAKLRREIKGLADYAHKNISGSALSAQWNGLKQKYQTGAVTPAQFVHETRGLLAQGKIASPRLSPELEALWLGFEFLSKAKGEQLTAQIDGWISDRKAVLFTTPESKAVSELDRSIRLLGKLSKFELSRKEWEALRECGVRRTERGEPHSGGTLSEDIRSLQDQLLSIYHLPLAADFLRFYEIALQREAFFLKNIGQWLRTPDAARGTAVVVGGFHVAGLAAKLKEQGIAYAVISPKIRQMPEKNSYVGHMQGQVSWRSYFIPENGEINLYDAFTRSAVAQLVSRRVPGVAPRRELKAWRDDILRGLASEKRVGEHSKYTRFIDEALRKSHEEEAAALKIQSSAKLEDFIRKLQRLGNQNQLTESHIAKLFQSPANQTPVAVGSMVPGTNVPAVWIRDPVRPGLKEGARSEARGDPKQEGLENERETIAVLLKRADFPAITEHLIQLETAGEVRHLEIALDAIIVASSDLQRVPCCVHHDRLNTIVSASRKCPGLRPVVAGRVANYLNRGTGDKMKSVISELVQKMIAADMVKASHEMQSFVESLVALVSEENLISKLTDYFRIYKEWRAYDHFWKESLDGKDVVLSEEKDVMLKAYSQNGYFMYENKRPVGVVYATASRSARKAFVSVHIFDKTDRYSGLGTSVIRWLSGVIASSNPGEEGMITTFEPAESNAIEPTKSNAISFMCRCVGKGILDRVEVASAATLDVRGIPESPLQWEIVESLGKISLQPNEARFVRGIVPARPDQKGNRSEAREQKIGMAQHTLRLSVGRVAYEHGEYTAEHTDREIPQSFSSWRNLARSLLHAYAAEYRKLQKGRISPERAEAIHKIIKGLRDGLGANIGQILMMRSDEIRRRLGVMRDAVSDKKMESEKKAEIFMNSANGLDQLSWSDEPELEGTFTQIRMARRIVREGRIESARDQILKALDEAERRLGLLDDLKILFDRYRQGYVQERSRANHISDEEARNQAFETALQAGGLESGPDQLPRIALLFYQLIYVSAREHPVFFKALNSRIHRRPLIEAEQKAGPIQEEAFASLNETQQIEIFLPESVREALGQFGPLWSDIRRLKASRRPEPRNRSEVRDKGMLGSAVALSAEEKRRVNAATRMTRSILQEYGQKTSLQYRCQMHALLLWKALEKIGIKSKPGYYSGHYVVILRDSQYRVDPFPEGSVFETDNGSEGVLAEPGDVYYGQFKSVKPEKYLNNAEIRAAEDNLRRNEAAFLSLGRSEARLGQVYTGVLDAVLMGKPAENDVLLDFTYRAQADLEKTVAGLREAFLDFGRPASAERIEDETRSQAAGYGVLENVLSQKNLSREAFTGIVEQLFMKELKILAEAIEKREIQGMAPVIFYSPAMKAQLLRFIETVQESFETAGDVTGEDYRITLVSANKAELMKFKAELSKRGALRGVSFEENEEMLAREVFENIRFKDRWGVFFPEKDAGSKAPWQRVVRSEIPKEYAILLLPALSRYFASVPTSDINATTLRQALPDMVASVAFRAGQGIAIVAAFLERIAAADHEISASA